LKKKKNCYSQVFFSFPFCSCGKQTQVFSSLCTVPEKKEKKRRRRRPFGRLSTTKGHGDFVELIGVNPDLPLPHLRNYPPVQPSSQTDLTPDSHVPPHPTAHWPTV